MAVRRSDYEDECGNVDWDAYQDAQDDYGDMKYEEARDRKMEEEEERRLEQDLIEKTKPPLQLSGVDGNVFNIIGLAKKSAARFNRDMPVECRIDMDTIEREATSGDYDHVIQTLMKHFNVS